MMAAQVHRRSASSESAFRFPFTSVRPSVCDFYIVLKQRIYGESKVLGVCARSCLLAKEGAEPSRDDPEPAEDPEEQPVEDRI